MSMETRWNTEGGKIKLECDSNSLAAMFGIMQTFCNEIDEALWGTSGDDLNKRQKEVLDYIRYAVEELGQRLSVLDTELETVPEAIALPFWEDSK